MAAHMGTPILDTAALSARYQQATKRLFMFDYDGTLTPIVQDPSAATPTDTVTQTIQRLATDPHNTVWIISGRDQVFLDRYLGGIPELGLSAEHGSFMREPRSTEWRDLVQGSDVGWQAEVLKIFESFTEMTQGEIYVMLFGCLRGGGLALRF